MAPAEDVNINSEETGFTAKKAVAVALALAAAGAIGYTAGSVAPTASNLEQVNFGIDSRINSDGTVFGNFKGQARERLVDTAAPRDSRTHVRGTKLPKNAPIEEGGGRQFVPTKAPRAVNSPPEKSTPHTHPDKAQITKAPREQAASFQTRGPRTGTKASRAFAEANHANTMHRHERVDNHKERSFDQTRIPGHNTRVPREEGQKDAGRWPERLSPNKDDNEVTGKFDDQPKTPDGGQCMAAPDCESDFCDNGICAQPKKQIGEACIAAADCETDFCGTNGTCADFPASGGTPMEAYCMALDGSATTQSICSEYGNAASDCNNNADCKFQAPCEEGVTPCKAGGICKNNVCDNTDAICVTGKKTWYNWNKSRSLAQMDGAQVGCMLKSWVSYNSDGTINCKEGFCMPENKNTYEADKLHKAHPAGNKDDLERFYWPSSDPDSLIYVAPNDF